MSLFYSSGKNLNHGKSFKFISFESAKFDVIKFSISLRSVFAKMALLLFTAFFEILYDL